VRCAPADECYLSVMRVSKGRGNLIIPTHPELFNVAGAAHGSVYLKALDGATF